MFDLAPCSCCYAIVVYGGTGLVRAARASGSLSATAKRSNENRNCNAKDLIFPVFGLRLQLGLLLRLLQLRFRLRLNARFSRSPDPVVSCRFGRIVPSDAAT